MVEERSLAVVIMNVILRIRITETIVQKMIEANPGNSLLSNYARFLKESRGILWEGNLDKSK